MSRRNTLEKLQALRAVEPEKGFKDNRACFSWAAKIEPLLSFNLQYQITFNSKLQILHRGLSPQATVAAFQEMITILDMAIEQLKHELESEKPSSPIKLLNTTNDYINQERIKELSSIKSKVFDLTKLIQFCNELNSSHQAKNSFSIIMLCRAVIDHVPPIFGVKNFNEVANNYTGTKSFKESMERLNNSSRKIADQHLHTQIRDSEVLPVITQVDFSNDIDVLLSEIVRILKNP